MSIFATKAIEQIKEEQLGDGSGGLKRVLGVWQLVMLGIGAIIGTGIFVLTGQAAAANAGPAIVISMVIAGVTSVLAAFCYSEFASTRAGRRLGLTYAYATLGELVAWVIGWDLILEYALGAATVAVGWSGNPRDAARPLGHAVSGALSAAPGTVVHFAGGDHGHGGLQPSGDARVARHGAARRRRQRGRPVNAVIVVIKVAIVLDRHRRRRAVHRPANWHPFIPPNTGTFGEYGWSGVLRGAGVIFFAYIGFDAVSTAAQEARNPQRDMPRGIIGSLAICTVLYVLVSGVMVGSCRTGDAGSAGADGGCRRGGADRAAGTAWEALMA